MELSQVPNSVKESMTAHLLRLLTTRDYPKTICPSEVVRSLSTQDLQDAGVERWRDLMPAIRSMVWERMDGGEVEVLQHGEVLPSRTRLEDVRGPIRVRNVV